MKRSRAPWLLLLALGCRLPAAAGAAPNWVGTWATSPQYLDRRQVPSTPDFRGGALRQIVHVSIGGQEIRLRLSNAFGHDPVVFTGVHVARAQGGSAIDPRTDRALTFGGRRAVTVAAGATAVSDPVAFELPALADVAITLAVDLPKPGEATVHPGSRATSYLQKGGPLAAPRFAAAETFDRWYFISGLDVAASTAAGAIVILGDSITDGHGATTNGNDRWTDVLARRLQAAPETARIGVLNEGIGGNRLLRDGLGPRALARVERDVLDQPGVRWLVVFEGVNDIGPATGARAHGLPAASADDIISAYRQIVARARARGIRALGATITPFGGFASYYSAAAEAERRAVNDWIRAPGNFDAVIDFDALLRDAADPTRLAPENDGGDHLHPSVAGYRRMGEGVNPALFSAPPRERLSLDDGWRFHRYAQGEKPDDLIYDVRPAVTDDADDRAADAKPTEAVAIHSAPRGLKGWILPTGNGFVGDRIRRRRRPPGDPGGDFPFVQRDFDDQTWEPVTLPHDWAIAGPFSAGPKPEVGGGMGRLPSPGVAWYRKKLEIPASDAGRSVFLDVDGAMAYAEVWLNGHLVGGWPYGYTSFRLDLTPYAAPGGANQLAMRLDNPPNSSRWYPGGGLYRNVWLTKTAAQHVAHWGTRVITREVSAASAVVELKVTIDNDAAADVNGVLETAFYLLDQEGRKSGGRAGRLRPTDVTLPGKGSVTVRGVATIAAPQLWGPPPSQIPHRYVAVTTLSRGGRVCDRYETPFGIRVLRFDPDRGLFVNGERVPIHGVNLHHDLGALGAAFNLRAAQRRLELLQQMGCNAIRMAHNPPAPELLELTDAMGFLVVDEIYDAWERKKAPLDFHLVFSDWQEQDLRAMVRRDRNHPSVILWSIGNEVGEQYTGAAGATVARRLRAWAREEDPSRLAMTAMNYAKPAMPLPDAVEVISLNYQGEGIRNGPAYAGLKGNSGPPLYAAFHEKFPGKLIFSSESAAAVSSRGEYLFPVEAGDSAPVKEGRGGDEERRQVSGYGLYTADFGSSPDKVFAAEDRHPFVAGEFVWSGWDYLGEPTPYSQSRSSYFGIVDLAGFPKDRFYLYQSRWRPELPMAHLLPHWTWPERVGRVTPVHVFTSGDAAELFLNGRSLGRKTKSPLEYRLRWDDVRYEPGELKVVAYRNGKRWAEDVVRTAGAPARLALATDRQRIRDDGRDLAFVTVRVTDRPGVTAPRASNAVRFRIEGPGDIVATDNGDPTNLVPFPSPERDAFNGLGLAIVRGRPGQPGTIRVNAESGSLAGASISLESSVDLER